MITNLAEDKFDAVASVAQADYLEHQLAEFRLESTALLALSQAEIVAAESATLDHIIKLKKANKLNRRLERIGKELEREQLAWAELDSNLGQ